MVAGWSKWLLAGPITRRMRVRVPPPQPKLSEMRAVRIAESRPSGAAGTLGGRISGSGGLT